MKKILFFENSLSLHKAIKLILSNLNIYDVKIVDTLAKFEKEKKSHIFDLIISNVNLINPDKYKKNMELQSVLFMYEVSDSLKEHKELINYHFIEKPFSSMEFKKKVDFILGIDEDLSDKSEQQKPADQIIQNFVKETMDKWLREQAPQYAKEVIREEIMKLIG